MVFEGAGRKAIDAVILAAGRGRRLRPVTDYVAKPMVPFCGQPFLQYTLDNLVGQIERAILVVHYRARDFHSFFGDNWHGLPLEYVWQETLQGTGEALLSARDHLKGPFLALLGDVYLSPHLLRAMLDHSAGNLLTLALVDDPENHLGVDWTDGRATALGTASRWVDRGLWRFDSSIWEYLEGIPPRDDELRALAGVSALIQAGQPVEVLLSEEPWIQIGDHAGLEGVLEANRFFLAQAHRSAYGGGPTDEIQASSVEAATANCRLVQAVVAGGGRLRKCRLERCLVFCDREVTGASLAQAIAVL